MMTWALSLVPLWLLVAYDGPMSVRILLTSGNVASIAAGPWPRGPGTVGSLPLCRLPSTAVAKSREVDRLALLRASRVLAAWSARNLKGPPTSEDLSESVTMKGATKKTGRVALALLADGGLWMPVGHWPAVPRALPGQLGIITVLDSGPGSSVTESHVRSDGHDDSDHCGIMMLESRSEEPAEAPRAPQPPLGASGAMTRLSRRGHPSGQVEPGDGTVANPARPAGRPGTPAGT